MKVEPNRVGQFPFRKANPEERKHDFSEVQQPYTEEEVMQEANRCLLCGTPVCIDACPVLLDVRGMNEAVARRDFKTAYERIRETNPLLGVTGRCCPQLQGLCEDACVLKWSGQPIGIGLIQRYVADWERKNKQPPPSIGADTGKKIAVIGTGPAGVAGADLLKRYGHHVVIYEALPTPGGTAWYGIPDYHLPKDVLLHEIEKVKEMGVEIKTNVMIEEAKEEGVKFRFLAQPKSFEGSDKNHVVAVVMDSMQLGKPDQSGRRNPEPIPGKEFKMQCSAVLLAIGRGPDSFLQKQAGLKMSKHDSIAVNDKYKTSMEGVFAAGDVTSGETLVVKAMESGREAAQRVHEYLMGLEDQHISFYERYYKQNIYDRMLEGKVDTDLPPD